MKIFCSTKRGKIKICGSFDMFYFHPIHKNVGNLSKIGVHTSNCCIKKWTKEIFNAKIGSCEPTLRSPALSQVYLSLL